MSDLYFEDFTVGRRFRSPWGITLTEPQIVEFALTHDPQPFHIDVEAARHSIFGGLVASGFQTLGLSFRLFHLSGVLGHNLGASGIDELRWLLPVRPGDTLRVETEVLAQIPSRSRPDRGIVRFAYSTFNQSDQQVLGFIGNHIMARRPEPVAV